MVSIQLQRRVAFLLIYLTDHLWCACRSASVIIGRGFFVPIWPTLAWEVGCIQTISESRVMTWIWLRCRSGSASDSLGLLGVSLAVILLLAHWFWTILKPDQFGYMCTRKVHTWHILFSIHTHAHSNHACISHILIILSKLNLPRKNKPLWAEKQY